MEGSEWGRGQVFFKKITLLDRLFIAQKNKIRLFCQRRRGLGQESERGRGDRPAEQLLVETKGNEEEGQRGDKHQVVGIEVPTEGGSGRTRMATGEPAHGVKRTKTEITLTIKHCSCSHHRSCLVSFLCTFVCDWDDLSVCLYCLPLFGTLWIVLRVKSQLDGNVSRGSPWLVTTTATTKNTSRINLVQSSFKKKEYTKKKRCNCRLSFQRLLRMLSLFVHCDKLLLFPSFFCSPLSPNYSDNCNLHPTFSLSAILIKTKRETALTHTPNGIPNPANPTIQGLDGLFRKEPVDNHSRQLSRSLGFVVDLLSNCSRRDLDLDLSDF